MISRKKRKRYLSVAFNLSKKYNEPIDLTNWEDVWNIIDKYGEESYVYVIGCKELSQVKIGRSKNPGQRLLTLQTGFPYKLKLWAFCPESKYLTEHDLHILLAKDRIEGEWFTLSPEVQHEINQLKAHSAGSIDSTGSTSDQNSFV